MKINRMGYFALGVVCTLALGSVTTAYALSGTKTIKAFYNNIKLTVNGKTVSTPQEPFTVDGTTYLPVRSVAEALNMDVTWDGNTNTVKITDKATSGTNTNTNTNTNTGAYIGEDKAKSIALEHAGVTASQAKFAWVEMDRDDGIVKYDVEFYYGNKEYDYEINATTGAIISYDYDMEYDHNQTQNNTTNTTQITKEKAESIAKAKAPNATLIFIKLDYDDGRAIYEGELRDGKTEYDFEIDATTGNVIQWDVDYDD